MSDSFTRLHKSERLAKTNNAIKKQTKIAKQHRIGEYESKEIEQPHRYNKHHALDCGNPRCMLCSNARKTHGERTIQERKFIEGNKDDTQNS